VGCRGRGSRRSYFALETGPYWVHVLRSLFRDQDVVFPAYYTTAFAVLALVLGPPWRSRARCCRCSSTRCAARSASSARRPGRLYSTNTLGSLAGALIGGYALFYWLDLHQVYRVAVCALALAAVLATLRELPRSGSSAPGRRCSRRCCWSVVPAVGQQPIWSRACSASARPSLDLSGPVGDAARTMEAPLFYDDDPNSSVAVLAVQIRDRDSRSIVVNGKSDGTRAPTTRRWRSRRSCRRCSAERMEHAFVIGFGTGVSAGDLASLEEAKSVTVAEISRGVIEAAPFFDDFNGGVTQNREDPDRAQRRLSRAAQGARRFDVILSEPSNPWVTGVEMLSRASSWTRRAAALARGRVLPVVPHLRDESGAVELVLRTYASVFDHVAVWSVNQATCSCWDSTTRMRRSTSRGSSSASRAPTSRPG
jgi:spermidine synthase